MVGHPRLLGLLSGFLLWLALPAVAVAAEIVDRGYDRRPGGAGEGGRSFSGDRRPGGDRPRRTDADGALY